jgi:predicted PurR-regulated permease PerM
MFSNFWDAKTARVLSTILIFAVVLFFLHGARETLTLFLFSILYAYFIEPVVSFFQRKLRGRIRGIVAAYVSFTGVVVGLGFLLGPRIGQEAKDLMTSGPALLDRIATGQFILNMGQSQGWTHERAMQIQSVFMAHRAAILAYGENLAERLEKPLMHIWWIVLIPILSVFFLKDARMMAYRVVELGTDSKKRSVLRGILGDVNVMLGSYIRAQLILAALTACVLTAVLGLMHAPFAFILGPMAGVCEFVPVVGPAVASAAIFGIALLSGYPHLVWIFLFLGTWRVIQDYVNAPRIMGKSLEISPLAEIFAVLAGGEIGGVIGALVSVPILAVLRILWLRLSVMRNMETPITAEGHSGAEAPAREGQGAF